MYARGMSVLQNHLRELYGIEASPQLISTVTDAVLEEVCLDVIPQSFADSEHHPHVLAAQTNNRLASIGRSSDLIEIPTNRAQFGD